MVQFPQPKKGIQGTSKATILFSPVEFPWQNKSLLMWYLIIGDIYRYSIPEPTDGAHPSTSGPSAARWRFFPPPRRSLIPTAPLPPFVWFFLWWAWASWPTGFQEARRPHPAINFWIKNLLRQNRDRLGIYWVEPTKKELNSLYRDIYFSLTISFLVSALLLIIQLWLPLLYFFIHRSARTYIRMIRQTCKHCSHKKMADGKPYFLVSVKQFNQIGIVQYFVNISVHATC